MPTASVNAWLGFDPEEVEVEIGGRYDQLYSHNDGRTYEHMPDTPPRTFAEIADAIEEQL